MSCLSTLSINITAEWENWHLKSFSSRTVHAVVACLVVSGVCHIKVLDYLNKLSSQHVVLKVVNGVGGGSSPSRLVVLFW